MADWLKIAIKIAILGILLATVLALISLIQVPVVEQDFTDVLGKPLAVISHYVPHFDIFWTWAKVLIAYNFAVLLAKPAIQAYKWIIKVNE